MEIFSLKLKKLNQKFKRAEEVLNQNQIRDHQKKEIQMEIMDPKKNHKVNHLIMVDHKAKESHRVQKNLIVKEKLLKIINP